MANIDLKSSTIEKSLDLVKDFLQKLAGHSLDELGFTFSDNMKLRRLKNQIRNFEKVKKMVEDSSITMQQINLKVLFPYLENVSLEEDETLQQLWANLIVNYIDSKENLTINVYPHILKHLSSNEITILNYLKTKTISISHFNRTKDLEFSYDELANLTRLGLINEDIKLSQYGGDYTDNGQYQWDIEQSLEGYYLSDFGTQFLSACSRENK